MKRFPRPSRSSLILSFTALLGALPALALAEDATPPAPPAHHEKMRENADRLADELGLTDEQRAKMKPLFQQERAELETLRADTSLAKADRRAKAAAIHQKYREQRDALLTPEQRAKADKLRENFGKRRAEQGEKPADK